LKRLGGWLSGSAQRNKGGSFVEMKERRWGGMEGESTLNGH